MIYIARVAQITDLRSYGKTIGFCCDANSKERWTVKSAVRRAECMLLFRLTATVNSNSLYVDGTFALRLACTLRLLFTVAVNICGRC